MSLVLGTNEFRHGQRRLVVGPEPCRWRVAPLREDFHEYGLVWRWRQPADHVDEFTVSSINQPALAAIATLNECPNFVSNRDVTSHEYNRFVELADQAETAIRASMAAGLARQERMSRMGRWGGGGGRRGGGR